MSERLSIRVIPRAKRNEVAERDGRLLVRTTSAPVDGKANAAVIELLAAHLGVKRRQIEIVSGAQSRDKVVEIDRHD